MKFPAPIQKGKLVKRYKRFLADIDLGGDIITAHCANTGSMMGVKEPGAVVWVSKAQNPNRKLSYDWQVIEVGNAKVCINTSLTNSIVEEAIRNETVPELSGYGSLTREVKYGENSRIDILLKSEGRAPCYVEVKNVTLSRSPPLAEFPDSPTARGTKHLKELAQMVRDGHRAVMFYCVNRTDCERFTLAADLDPAYAQMRAMACETGVEILSYRCEITENGISLGPRLPFA